MTKFRLSRDKKQIHAAFREWLDILKTDEIKPGSVWQIDGSDVRLRRIHRGIAQLDTDFWIGSATRSALQINEPRIVTTENKGGHLALDARGRRYIIRQGDIHGNDDFDRVRGQTFIDRTGYPRLDVRTEKGPSAKQWHLVARLDGQSDAAIRRATVEFVRRCWNARTYGTQAADDQKRIDALLGKSERGGWHDIEPDATPRRVLRVQGYVLEQLEEILDNAGIEIGKSRHAAGYEVDAEIAAPGGKILVEVKTGISPADVYCGIGQLTVYPLILTSLANYPKILLLPGRPSAALSDALAACGVELHSYEIKRGRKKAKATFSGAFLQRCGMTKKQIAALT